MRRISWFHKVMIGAFASAVFVGWMSPEVYAASCAEANKPSLKPPVMKPATEVKRIDVSTPTPFKTVTQADHRLVKGTTKTLVEGRPGAVVESFAVTVVNGDMIRARHVSTVTVKPVDEVVATGTALPPGTISRGGSELRYSRAIEVSATAYCPCEKCCGQYASGYTATGLPLRRGIVAVDPSVIPIGTRMWVEGYGMGLAADKGTAIKGLRIDVAFDDHDEALGFGRRNTTVYLLEE